MPASAWMPASHGLQDRCNGSSQRHLMAVKSLQGLYVPASLTITGTALVHPRRWSVRTGGVSLFAFVVVLLAPLLGAARRIRSGYTSRRDVRGNSPCCRTYSVSSDYYGRCWSPGDDRAITYPHRVDRAKQHRNALRTWAR